MTASVKGGIEESLRIEGLFDRPSISKSAGKGLVKRIHRRIYIEVPTGRTISTTLHRRIRGGECVNLQSASAGESEATAMLLQYQDAFICEIETSLFIANYI